jgi:hypothetical protein
MVHLLNLYSKGQNHPEWYWHLTVPVLESKRGGIVEMKGKLRTGLPELVSRPKHFNITRKYNGASEMATKTRFEFFRNVMAIPPHCGVMTV